MTQATPQKPTPSPAARAAAKQAVRNALTAMAVLALGTGVVYGLEVWLDGTFDKPPAQLSKPLDQMSKQLGSPPRYVAERADEILDHEVVETLGTNDYLVRAYRDTKMRAGEPGEFINLNVNYYATGSSSPHVPEVCWVGVGRTMAPGSGETFEVTGVRRKHGPPTSVRVKLISFLPTRAGTSQTEELPPGPDGEPVYTNVAYLFQVNGQYVSNANEVTSHFWKASNLYAYHSKIEMTPMVRAKGVSDVLQPMLCSRSEAKRLVSEFLREALVEVEECLPDPAILTNAAPQGAAAGTQGAHTR